MATIHNSNVVHLVETGVEAPLWKGKNRKSVRKFWRRLTYQECQELTPRFIVHFLSSDYVYRMRVTSIKKWKRTNKIEVRWQYGLYRFGKQVVYPDVEIPFVMEVA